MVNLEEFFDRLETLDGVDVQGIIDFIELMAEGKTSEWYTADKKAKFQELDLTQAHAVIDNARSAGLRKGLIDNKLRNLAPAMPNDVDYF